MSREIPQARKSTLYLPTCDAEKIRILALYLPHQPPGPVLQRLSHMRGLVTLGQVGNCASQFQGAVISAGG